MKGVFLAATADMPGGLEGRRRGRGHGLGARVLNMRVRFLGGCVGMEGKRFVMCIRLSSKSMVPNSKGRISDLKEQWVMETCEIPRRTFSPPRIHSSSGLPDNPVLRISKGLKQALGVQVGCPGLPNTEEVGSKEQRASATPGLASAGPAVHSWPSV